VDEKGGLGAFIRMQREFANLSLRQLADSANVSNAYLSQVERNIYRPSAQVLKGIADALHLSVETLYARAGLLDEEPRPGVEEAIRLDDRLTAEQQETLIRVYRSYTGEG
jgi:transcriptional regulator with XRE-family HTH domain